VGGDLEEALPEISKSRASHIAALPEDARRDKKKSQRKKLAANDPKAQGGVLSARQLAKEGAGLFVAPLDKTRLKREVGLSLPGVRLVTGCHTGCHQYYMTFCVKPFSNFCQVDSS
jgi:hypothetical protein